MDFDTYAREAQKTAIYGAGVNFLVYDAELEHTIEFLRISYCAHKVAGEAGEIAEHIGKCLRDGEVPISSERRELLLKECGDLLWEFTALVKELGLSLDLVAETNLEKLRDRQERGVLGGSGDNR